VTTLDQHLDSVWRSRGDRIAVREDGADLSFAELLAWSERISSILMPLIHEPGERVAILLRNSAAFVAAFAATARIGGVVAPLNVQYRAQELRYYLEDLDPVAVITEAALLGHLREVTRALHAKPAIVALPGPRDAGLADSGGGHRATTVAVRQGLPLLQQYTSGSTGTPKRVVRTHEALLRELVVLRDVFDTTEDDRFLGAAPFSHVNGLVRTMLTSMYVGAMIFPVTGFHRRDVLDLIRRERITFLGAVPQMFVILGQTPARGEVDMSSVRLAFSSSAPLHPDDNRRFHDRYGIWVRQLYGSTETGTISFNRSPQPERSLHSVGTPLPGVRVSVVDAALRPLDAGVEGDIAIASPFAAARYEGNAVATHESFRGGTYLSGDLGVVDRDGMITLTGRKKLVINRGGFKVNPYEVEDAIRSHPKVADVAVYGSTNAHGTEIVACIVVPRRPCTAEEVVQHCRDLIADYKIPARIEFRDALPKTSTGKVLREQLNSGCSRRTAHDD
jgi:long-chain acyl-CoA synthetase